MKNTIPFYYKQFRCIADKCPDTCCAGWEIVVDGKSAEKYRRVPGAIGDKLRQAMTEDADGDIIFRSENGRCPFLLESGLCEIYSGLGEEALCATCTRFPRHVTFLGSRTETGISLSCPEAARIIMSGAPSELITEDAPGEIVPSDFDPELYFLILSLRKRIFTILDDDSTDIFLRLADVLRLCENADRFIRSGDYSEAKKYIDAFTPGEALPEYRPAAAKRALNTFFADHAALEFLDESRRDFLTGRRKKHSVYPEQNEIQRLAFYFIYRYLITAVFDGNIMTKIRFCVQAVIVIRELCLFLNDINNRDDRISVMRLYSKEVEHSGENMEYLKKRIKKSRYYSVSNLINILSEKENDNEIL